MFKTWSDGCPNLQCNSLFQGTEFDETKQKLFKNAVAEVGCLSEGGLMDCMVKFITLFPESKMQSVETALSSQKNPGTKAHLAEKLSQKNTENVLSQAIIEEYLPSLSKLNQTALISEIRKKAKKQKKQTQAQDVSSEVSLESKVTILKENEAYYELGQKSKEILTHIINGIESNVIPGDKKEDRSKISVTITKILNLDKTVHSKNALQEEVQDLTKIAQPLVMDVPPSDGLRTAAIVILGYLAYYENIAAQQACLGLFGSYVKILVAMNLEAISGKDEPFIKKYASKLSPLQIIANMPRALDASFFTRSFKDQASQLLEKADSSNSQLGNNTDKLTECLDLFQKLYSLVFSKEEVLNHKEKIKDIRSRLAKILNISIEKPAVIEADLERQEQRAQAKARKKLGKDKKRLHHAVAPATVDDAVQEDQVLEQQTARILGKDNGSSTRDDNKDSVDAVIGILDAALQSLEDVNLSLQKTQKIIAKMNTVLNAVFPILLATKKGLQKSLQNVESEQQKKIQQYILQDWLAPFTKQIRDMASRFETSGGLAKEFIKKVTISMDTWAPVLSFKGSFFQTNWPSIASQKPAAKQMTLAVAMSSTQSKLSSTTSIKPKDAVERLANPTLSKLIPVGVAPASITARMSSGTKTISYAMAVKTPTSEQQQASMSLAVTTAEPSSTHQAAIPEQNTNHQTSLGPSNGEQISSVLGSTIASPSSVFKLNPSALPFVESVTRQDSSASEKDSLVLEEINDAASISSIATTSSGSEAIDLDWSTVNSLQTELASPRYSVNMGETMVASANYIQQLEGLAQQQAQQLIWMEQSLQYQAAGHACLLLSQQYRDSALASGQDITATQSAMPTLFYSYQQPHNPSEQLGSSPATSGSALSPYKHRNKQG